MISRVAWLVVAVACLLTLVLAALAAPDHLASFDMAAAYASPWVMPPFGADERGRPLVEYALDRKSVV